MAARGLFRNFDWVSLCLAVLLASIGVATIYATAQGRMAYPQRQFAFLAAGTIVAVAIALIDYQHITRYAYPIFGAALVLLLLVPLIGERSFGARRWISLGSSSLRIQPSEFAKIAVIIVLARFLGDRGADIRYPRTTVAALALAGVPMLLIASQPDLGTALVILPVTLAMLYLAGVPRRTMVIIVLCLLAVAPLMWFKLHDYQKARLQVFLNPDSDPAGDGWAIIQSKTAIGSGGAFGRGFRAGHMTNLGFLTASTRDFIFSTVAEEWGFVGACSLLALYASLLVRSLGTARLARDRSGTLLAAGLATLVFVHILVNVGMTMGMMPVVGLPLPFMSYGGSSLVTMMLAVGLLMNVRMHRYVFYA